MRTTAQERPRACKKTFNKNGVLLRGRNDYTSCATFRRFLTFFGYLGINNVAVIGDDGRGSGSVDVVVVNRFGAHDVDTVTMFAKNPSIL